MRISVLGETTDECSEFVLRVEKCCLEMFQEPESLDKCLPSGNGMLRDSRSRREVLQGRRVVNGKGSVYGNGFVEGKICLALARVKGSVGPLEIWKEPGFNVEREGAVWCQELPDGNIQLWTCHIET